MKYYVTLIMHDWKGAITGRAENYEFDDEGKAIAKAKEISEPDYVTLNHDVSAGDSADIDAETEGGENVFSKTLSF